MNSNPGQPSEMLCTRCGHPRSEHSEEMPYECMNADICDCESFSYLTADAAPLSNPGWRSK